MIENDLYKKSGIRPLRLFDLLLNLVSNALVSSPSMPVTPGSCFISDLNLNDMAFCFSRSAN